MRDAAKMEMVRILVKWTMIRLLSRLRMLGGDDLPRVQPKPNRERIERRTYHFVIGVQSVRLAEQKIGRTRARDNRRSQKFLKRTSIIVFLETNRVESMCLFLSARM